MEIKITKKIEREKLENVCITALEGGSNYWYLLSSGARKLIRSVVPKEKNPYIASAILEAALDHGVRIPIHDVEDYQEAEDGEEESEPIGWLDRDTLQERLQKLSDDDGYRWALDNELNENGDATSSDVVFQYMVLGEVIYG
jgi:hypothetical protein